MLATLRALWQINHDITRHFDLDYILFDLAFLCVYMLLLIRQKRWAALRVGGVCSIVMYLIDGVGWYLSGVREYGIAAPWQKHAVDFMMDISYGMVAFSWVWMAFDRQSIADVAFWTMLLFGGWLLVPLLSHWLHIDDQPVMTVRHMRSQVWLQITVVAVGYILLILLKVDWGTMLYVFWVGCMLAFMMEFSLYVSKVRPTDPKVLIYETLVLTNQGIPYLWVIKEKILPAIQARRAFRQMASE